MDQQEAQRTNEIPAEVKLAEPTPTDEHTEENEQVKDRIAKYGVTDVDQFIAKVQSDSIFAKHVVRDMLGLKTTPLALDKTSGARQEHNITGVLDHKEYPPVLKQEPNLGTSGEAPTTDETGATAVDPGEEPATV